MPTLALSCRHHWAKAQPHRAANIAVGSQPRWTVELSSAQLKSLKHLKKSSEFLWVETSGCGLTAFLRSFSLHWLLVSEFLWCSTQKRLFQNYSSVDAFIHSCFHITRQPQMFSTTTLIYPQIQFHSFLGSASTWWTLSVHNVLFLSSYPLTSWIISGNTAQQHKYAFHLLN